MSEVDIYDTIINGYYTFTQYWQNIDRVFVKIMQTIKGQHPNMTYEDILEKVKLVFISEGFPLPTITDSEILEVFDDITDDTSAQNMNALNIDDNDEEGYESEPTDTQPNENSNDDNPDGENLDDSNNGVITDIDMNALLQEFNTYVTQNHNTLLGQFLNTYQNISDNNNLSGVQQPGVQQPGVQQPGVQQPGVQQPGVQPTIIQSLGVIQFPVQSGLFIPMNLNNGLNSFLNKKVNVVIDKNVLKKFRNRQYKFLSDKIKELNKTCTICLDDYEETSKVKVLPCEHGFHSECITKWLTSENYKCPVCRKEIGSTDDHKIIDS
jgi:hypothetical protein